MKRSVRRDCFWIFVLLFYFAAPTTLAYAVANTCAATTYGCCPDGKTPAAGPHQSGCPGKEWSEIFAYYLSLNHQFYYLTDALFVKARSSTVFSEPNFPLQMSSTSKTAVFIFCLFTK